MGRAASAASACACFGVLVLACAGGGKGSDASYGVYEEGTPDSSASPSSAADDDDEGSPESSKGDGDAEGDDSMPPDLGSCTDDDDCVLPETSCYGMGTCEKGTCEFQPEPAGESCDDEDSCTAPDVCDGAGSCIGAPQPCDAPNASGGVCMAGLCMGLECNPGFGNCNDDWTDGCELPLDAEDSCGGCGEPCIAGENATAVCNGITCERACVAPWANCDGDWANGCEIPEGVPNMCDANGLTSGGCWTPYCGASVATTATNFGTWFCSECSTCHVPAADQCQWCNHDSGGWFSAESCYCGAYEDLSCAP